MRIRKAFEAVVVAGLVLGASAQVQAKDLSHRLGVGFANQFSINLPSLELKYNPDQAFAVAADLGVDTQTNNSAFGFALRLYRTIFTEDNLNFYGGAGAGLLSYQNPGTKNNSGFELSGFVGCEFFLPGLKNLALDFDAGFGITSMSDGVRFRTIGEDPFHAGMIFYF